jgi:hypothetical protein
MTWNSIMGLISTIALFLPIILIIGLRLSAYNSFPALLIYYIFVFVYNLLTEGYIKADSNAIYNFGLIDNMIDAPFMLYFLTYFGTSVNFIKQMKRSILVFIAFEIVVILLRGFNMDAVTIIMAPGLLLVSAFCVHFFIRQTKITIMHRKATGKALMAASLLFAYGCYSIIYLIYYVFKTHLNGKQVKQQDVDDTFLVYFLVTTFSSMLMCAGLIIERRRIQKLNELKITRKELSVVYKDTAAPIKPIILDFDKEQWN